MPIHRTNGAAAAARLGIPSSAGLARRAARGDRSAFEAIYRRFHQELYRYCMAILHDPDDAQDALQATMTAALRSLPGDERTIELRPWLYRVAHNESISLLRARVALADPERAEGSTSVTPEVELEARDRLRVLVADLQQLPDRQRSALVMRELSDLSYGEIALALDCAEGAARQTVYEARTALGELGEGREMDCEPVRQAISAQDRRRLRSRRIRAHLSSCDACFAFEASIGRRRDDLQALCPPLPAFAAASILGGLLGGSGAGSAVGGAAGAAGALGGGGAATLAGSGLAGSAAIKVASVAAAAVVAAGAADVAGVVDLPGTGGRESSEAGSPASSGAEGGEVGSGGGAPGTNGQPGAGLGGAREDDLENESSTVRPDPEKGEGADGPGRSELAPGRTGAAGRPDDPGNSGSAPGHSGDGRGKSESAPSHSGSGRGNSANAPGRAGKEPKAVKEPKAEKPPKAVKEPKPVKPVKEPKAPAEPGTSGGSQAPAKPDPPEPQGDPPEAKPSKPPKPE